MEEIKDFYSIQELVRAPWFPVLSTITIKKLIEQRKLKAIDISTNSKFKRYRILGSSVKQFLQELN